MANWRNRNRIIMAGGNKSYTGSTGDVSIAQGVIPAGALEVGDLLRFNFMAESDEAAAATDSVRVWIGTSATIHQNSSLCVGPMAGNDVVMRMWDMLVLSSTTCLVWSRNDLTVPGSGVTTTSPDVRNTLFDISAEMNVFFGVALSNASNTFTYHTYSAELIKAK